MGADMDITRRRMLASAAAVGALPTVTLAETTGKLRRAARDAWIYVLPLIEMAATRAGTLNPPAPREPLAPNKFRHARSLTTPQDRLVTAPNNDTLFSNAWVDLTRGPVTLTIPPTGARYISVAVMDMYTDNDAVLGTRTIGGGGGRFTLVGPGETGSGPNIVRLSTPHGWLLVRTLIDGEADLPAAHAVQDGLGLEGPATPQPPIYATRHANWADFFTSAQQLLVSDPPPATDARMLASLAPLGLDARGGFDPKRFDAAAAAEIEAGIEDGRAALRQGLPPTVVQGWTYPRVDLGFFKQDYVFRANVALFGLAALPREETMYMRAVSPDGGTSMHGDEAWRLSFAKGALPPVDGFWSITMYEQTEEGQTFLTPNPINRYSIGDRTAGVKTNPDGSLDIWISRADPGPERRANWLPAPAEGPYVMSFRTYLPRPAIQNGEWRIPPLVKV
jgi:hypothetical protein